MVRVNVNERIAVISDDPQLRARAVALLNYLESHGCSWAGRFSNSGGAHISAAGSTALIIENNLNCDDLNKIQSLSFFKTIIVVSQANDEQTIVTALCNGADLYFDINESDLLLSERLLAAFRMHGKKERIKIDAPPYGFDLQRRQVFLDDQPIELTPMEYRLAEYFFRHPDQVIGKSELMERVWSLSRLDDARRIDTAAYQVRKKMQLEPHLSGWKLQNIRAVGLRLSGSTAL